MVNHGPFSADGCCALLRYSRRRAAGHRSFSRAAGAEGPRRPTVKVVDAIARILKIEGAEFLSAYPTTPLIEATAKVEIRPVLSHGFSKTLFSTKPPVETSLPVMKTSITEQW